MAERKEKRQNKGCVNCECVVGYGTRGRQNEDKIKPQNAVEVLLKSLMVFIPNPLVVPAVRIQRSSSVEPWRDDRIINYPPIIGGRTSPMAETKEVMETFITNFKGVTPSGWSLKNSAYVVCSNNQLHVPPPRLSTDEPLLSEMINDEDY